jgi:hypothetical protein
MQELLNKLREIETEIVREKGEFTLFALLQREDAFGGKWDLVVAAPWIGEGRLETLKYLTSKITPKLNLEELLSLSKIVTVFPNDEPVQRLIRAIPVNPDQKPVEIHDWDYNGMPIARGYILTARPTPTSASALNAVAAGP